MKRKAIPKKIRFEVFKRDSFTCQYCGRKAPDIVLHIDHIEPVSKGGTNDILNLITSCQGCNSGKSARKLTDNSVIEKQRVQLEGLQERKEQIEMMFQWQKSLMDLDDQVINQLSEFWSELVPGFSLNESGKKGLNKLIKRFSLEEIMEAMRTSVKQYLNYENDEPTHESVEVTWKKVGGICNMKKVQKDKPYMKDIFYIRGILRNRLQYLNERMALELLEEAVLNDADIENLKDHAKKVKNWTNWRNALEDFIEGQQAEDIEEIDN